MLVSAINMNNQILSQNILFCSFLSNFRVLFVKTSAMYYLSQADESFHEWEDENAKFFIKEEPITARVTQLDIVVLSWLEMYHHASCVSKNTMNKRVFYAENSVVIVTISYQHIGNNIDRREWAEKRKHRIQEAVVI